MLSLRHKGFFAALRNDKTSLCAAEKNPPGAPKFTAEFGAKGRSSYGYDMHR
jgi:hypothetical protein